MWFPVREASAFFKTAAGLYQVITGGEALCACVPAERVH
jgi:hypothetical protein